MGSNQIDNRTIVKSSVSGNGTVNGESGNLTIDPLPMDPSSYEDFNPDIACDIYGNCASDRGVIKIPFIAPIPPTATPKSFPSPTPLPTMTLLPASIFPVPTAVPQISINDPAEPQSVQPITEEPAGPVFPTLAIISLITLMWVLSSAALADPRPKAILAIAKTISQRKDRYQS
jgi:hypothetical protein